MQLFLHLQKKIEKFKDLSLEFGSFQVLRLVIIKFFSLSKYYSEILKLLINENRDIIKKYKGWQEGNVIKIDNKQKKIWIFWWQGNESMPTIVKKCITSVYKYNNGHEVVLLSQNNFSKYIDLPSNILNNFHDGNIAITHFSDLLRLCLLKKWGGVWIDATILLTDKLDDIVFEMPFYSNKISGGSKYVSNSKWSTFFISGNANNIIFCMAYEVLCRYWEKHKILIDYFLFDFVIELCYETNPQIKKLIIDVPENNPGIHELAKHINERYDANFISNLCERTKLHKLSWKETYYKINEKGEKTTWSYLIYKCNL